MFISSAFAQTAPAATAGSTGAAGMLGGILPFVLMLAVLYFLMIRPQQKKAKEQKAMLDAIVVGDEIVTVGGVLGTVRKVGDNGYIHLEISHNVNIQMQRQAIAQVLPKGTIKN